jgi:hypothetical protein
MPGGPITTFSPGWRRLMGRVLRWARVFLLGLLLITGAAYWISRGCSAVVLKRYEHAVPPSSIQTLDDFLRWQSAIRSCREVKVRGVTYYHIIGPNAHAVASGGALYVFDAKGNFVGWSLDSGDVMRKEAIFYPEWWLPKSSSSGEISLGELKKKVQCRRSEPS